MPEPGLTRTYLESEAASLEPFGFVALGSPGDLLRLVEITRDDDGALLVRVPGRPRPFPELPVEVRTALAERGFRSEDPSDQKRAWCHEHTEAAPAVEEALGVLHDVLGVPEDNPVDIAHGSHRAEHEAEVRLDGLRALVEPILTEILGRAPIQDEDRDYVCPINDVKIIVAPRATPDGHVILRVFAVTNVGVSITPELGLFLARLNFGLMFGRFALDADHQAIFVDETLLGDEVSPEEVRFTVKAVAEIADMWDDRLKEMFGGGTFRELEVAARDAHKPDLKPGHGGYL